MRALLATSLGVLSTASLLLPPAAAAAAHGATQATGTAPGHQASATAEQRVPGSTQSLPLARDGSEPTDRGPRRDARSGPGGGAPTADGEQRTVRPFSLVGVVWDDAGERLGAQVRLRTRSAEDGSWSPWRTLHVRSGHAEAPLGHPEDVQGDEGGEHTRRGATAPLWVGPSDGVQVRIDQREDALPRGLRLELVDPGEAPAGQERGPGARRVGEPLGGPRHNDARGPSARPTGAESLTALPGLTRRQTLELAARNGFTAGRAERAGEPHVGPRPGIVIRSGWGADADLREGGFAYGDDVRMAFVHHTAGSNDYRCKKAPRVIRSIYRYHVKSLGWRDIGYNFLIDKCGTIYEGRAGGVTEPVRGAHTLGFNNATMGVAVLGNFEKKKPSKKATDAIAKLTAWKLGLYGVNAEGTTRMTSGGGKYPKGRKVKFHTVSGHRDGFATACPGDKLYGELPDIRKLAARLQGR